MAISMCVRMCAVSLAVHDRGRSGLTNRLQPVGLNFVHTFSRSVRILNGVRNFLMAGQQGAFSSLGATYSRAWHHLELPWRGVRAPVRYEAARSGAKVFSCGACGTGCEFSWVGEHEFR